MSSSPPRARLSVRIGFWARRVRTLFGVARMVIRTQGVVQLCRFAWRKFTRTFAADRESLTPAPVARRPLGRRVAIVIPTYGQTTLVADCVDSIWKSVPASERSKVRIVVVDDGSAPEVQEALRKIPAELVLKTRNEGYARGFNDGLATIPKDEDVIVLNNDTLVPPRSLERLAAFADANPDVGMIGPRLRDSSGHLQISYRQAPSLWALLHRTLLFRWTGLLRRAYRRYRRGTFNPDVQRRVQVLMGAAVLLPRDAFAEVGGWDEGYAFGGEDIDLSRRVNRHRRAA